MKEELEEFDIQVSQQIEDTLNLEGNESQMMEDEDAIPNLD